MLDLGDIVSWGTLDGSPQAGFDLLLSGMSTVLRSEVVGSFRDANRMCQHDVDEHTKDEIRLKLRISMVMKQGTPAALGSGRAGLTHTIHALIYSTRLTSPDWKGAVKKVNSSLTWTVMLAG